MKKFLIALIDFYRHQISPYKGGYDPVPDKHKGSGEEK